MQPTGILLPRLAGIRFAAIHNIHDVILKHLDRSQEPANVLRDKVKKGVLGMKSGKGFYDWTPESANAVRTRLINHLRSELKP